MMPREADGLTLSVLDVFACGLGAATLLLVALFAQLGEGADEDSGIVILEAEITLESQSPVAFALTAGPERAAPGSLPRALLATSGVAGTQKDLESVTLVVGGHADTLAWDEPAATAIPGVGQVRIANDDGFVKYRVTAFWRDPGLDFHVDVKLQRVAFSDHDHLDLTLGAGGGGDGGQGSENRYRYGRMPGGRHRHAFPAAVSLRVWASTTDSPSVLCFGIDDISPGSGEVVVSFETGPGLRLADPAFRATGLVVPSAGGDRRCGRPR